MCEFHFRMVKKGIHNILYQEVVGLTDYEPLTWVGVLLLGLSFTLDSTRLSHRHQHRGATAPSAGQQPLSPGNRPKGGLD